MALKFSYILTKIKFNIKRIFWSAGLLILVLWCFMVLGGSAQETKGSITLHCTFTDNEEKIILSGDTYAIAQIAWFEGVESDNIDHWQYVMCEEYRKYDCNWQSLTSMQLREKAMILDSAVRRNGSYLDRQTTDSNGKLIFDTLESGLYLIVRTNAVNVNYEFEPYLIAVPQTISGEVTYQMTAEPKFSVKSEESKVSSSPTDEKLPQTGQLILPIFVFAAIGIVLTATGIILIFKEKRHES